LASVNRFFKSYSFITAVWGELQNHHHHVRLLKKFDRLQTNIDVYKGKYS